MGKSRRRSFAAWVEPIAAELLLSRDQISRVARKLQAEHWSIPSPLEGWSYKDLLAHLAGDTGKLSSAIMHAAIVRGTLDDPGVLADGGDATNARDILRRRHQSVEELIEEVQADGREWQELLSQLRESDDAVTWTDFPLSLGGYLRMLAPHDREHTKQLRNALRTHDM